MTIYGAQGVRKWTGSGTNHEKVSLELLQLLVCSRLKIIVLHPESNLNRESESSMENISTIEYTE